MQIRAKHPVRLVTMAWAVVSVAGVTAAVATPPSGKVSRNELVTGKITDSITIERTEPSDVHIEVVTFEPGSSTGWHTHPGPTYAMVKAGQIVLQRAPDCRKVTVSAGQGAFIPGGTAHVAHNDGKDPAEVYSSQIMPAGTTVLRDDVDEQCMAKATPPEKTVPPDDPEPPDDTAPPEETDPPEDE